MLCILYVYLPVLSNFKALWSTGHMVVRALYKCQIIIIIILISHQI